MTVSWTSWPVRGWKPTTPTGKPRKKDKPADKAATAGKIQPVGVHPCFCGGFAERSDPQAIVVRPGYLDDAWTTDSWTNQGLRDKVGASHMPVAAIVNAVLAGGLEIRRVSEGGEPTPIVLSLQARKPSVAVSAHDDER
ncbi:MAG: hypothetical protein ABW195_10385 [Ilumatobacteraceae bacterium]